MRGRLTVPLRRNCDWCAAEFGASNVNHRFCQPRCKYAAAAKLRVERNAEKAHRTCYKCGLTKSDGEFHSRSHSYCAACTNAYNRVRTATLTPEARATRTTKRREEYQRVGREETRKQVRLWRWNLTGQDIAEILASQGGVCGICQGPEPGGRGTWHVDHDHACCPKGRSCGACVRGLLCTNCNLLLGHANDDPAVLRAAIAYLTRRLAA